MIKGTRNEEERGTSWRRRYPAGRKRRVGRKKDEMARGTRATCDNQDCEGTKERHCILEREKQHRRKKIMYAEEGEGESQGHLFTLERVMPGTKRGRPR